MEQSELYKVRGIIRHIYMDNDITFLSTGIIESIRNSCYDKDIKNISIDFQSFTISLEFDYYVMEPVKTIITEMILDKLSEFILETVPKDDPNRLLISNFISNDRYMLCERYSIGQKLNFML